MFDILPFALTSFLAVHVAGSPLPAFQNPRSRIRVLAGGRVVIVEACGDSSLLWWFVVCSGSAARARCARGRAGDVARRPVVRRGRPRGRRRECSRGPCATSCRCAGCRCRRCAGVASRWTRRCARCEAHRLCRLCPRRLARLLPSVCRTCWMPRSSRWSRCPATKTRVSAQATARPVRSARASPG